MPQEAWLAGVGTGLAAVGLCSLPAVSSFIVQLRKRDPKQDTYEDEDGKSTPEAVKAFSAKPSKAAITLFASIGCGLSLAVSVLGTLRLRDGKCLENWLCAAAWVHFDYSLELAPSRQTD